MTYLVNIPKLATILAKDVHLLENWNQFVGLLFTSIPSEAISWRTGFKSGIINAYDLFSNILEEWASRRGKMATIERLQKLLRKGEFNRAADSLDTLQKLEITINDEPFPPLPKCITNFVGRKAELRLLQNHFDRGEFLQVIAGTNGTGKSTLALKFASSQVQKNEGFQVLWLNKEDCRRFHIFKQFKFKNPMLFVLDDVESNNKSILEILTTLRDFGTGHRVLITTTQLPTKLVGSGHLKIILLCNLRQEEAINFLRENLNPQSISTEESLRKLIDLTGGLPLTIQQAVTYINQKSLEELTSYTVDNYISDLSSGSPNRTRKLLDQPLSPLEHFKGARTTFGTWKECLRKVAGIGVEGRQAIQLLRILALFNLKRVRIEALKLIVFTQVLLTNQDANKKSKINCMTQTTLDTCLKILKQNYLIHVENDNVSVHPMLRKVTFLKVNNKRALISSLLGHIQLNLLTSQFNKADIEIMACWATALSLKDLEVMQNYLEVGLSCVSNSDCPLTLIKDTLEFILQTDEDEYSDQVIQIKLIYFSKLGSEGIYFLESLLAQIGNSHPLAVNGKEALAAAYKAVEDYPRYICIVRELLDSCIDCDYGLFGLGEEEMRRMRDFGELAAEQNELELALHYFLCVYVWIKVREDFDLELDLQFWNKDELLEKIKKLSEEKDFNYSLLPDAEQLIVSPIIDRKPKVKRKWNVKFIISYLEKNCSKIKSLDFIKIIKALKLELIPHR